MLKEDGEIEDKRTENRQDEDMDCPPKLQEYINLANLIPVDFVFPAKTAVYGYAFEQYRHWVGPEGLSDESIILAYKHVLTKTPAKLFQYVFFLDDLNEIEKRYALVSILDHGIKSVAHAESWASEESDSNINEHIQAIVENVPGHVSIHEATVFVDEKGFLRPKNNEFFEFISNNNIPAERIRICAICQKIFWAVNKRNRLCSNQCGGILIKNHPSENDVDNLNKSSDLICSYLQNIKKNLH